MIRVLLLIAGMTAGTANAEEFQFRAERILGSSYQLKVIALDEATAQKAHEAALSEIARLENILSTWKTDSEISRLNAASEFSASQELFEYLKTCEKLRVETRNALSCRIGKLIEIWQSARETGVTPRESELAVLAKEIETAPLVMDANMRRIQRPDNIVFAVDAMAKGWILDRSAEKAFGAAEGVTGIILNVGGDLKIVGDVSMNVPRIGVAAPSAGENETPMETILVTQGGVASSGSGARDIDVGGRQYSHILSPRTGMPQDLVAVSAVVAPTAAQADALATAFTVMGIGNSLGFANGREGVEAVIVTNGGGRFSSDGWSSLLAPTRKLSASEADVENPWPNGFMLDIEYKVPVIEATNYEAPYVAVWITTPAKELVRSLLLLGDAPRWVEENHRYWRRYGRKQPAIIDTLAQPTRMPGRYHLVWDGRNDAGEPVSQGTYILHVEASREHGGHSYTNHELQLSNVQVEAIMPAQEEIGEVIIHYGPDE